MVKTFRFDNYVDETCANSYVVSDSQKSAVIVDIGLKPQRIIDYLKENNLFLKGILLTHGHWDHIAGVERVLDEFPGAQVFISELDSIMLDDPKLNLSYDIEELAKTVDVRPYIVEDQDEIRFSNELTFEVIETPFHTKGSVCFINKANNALFSGDTLFRGSIGRFDLPYNDFRKIRETLKIVKNFDPNLILYPGHGETSTMKKELEENTYLRKEN